MGGRVQERGAGMCITGSKGRGEGEDVLHYIALRAEIMIKLF